MTIPTDTQHRTTHQASGPRTPTVVSTGSSRSAAGPHVVGAVMHDPAEPFAAAVATSNSATRRRQCEVAVVDPGGRPRRSRWGNGEVWIRLATVAAVVTVALIAGVVSYWHMAGVAREHGEDRATSAIVPISVDGLIVAASLTLLADSRAGRRRSPLPYTLLALASAASIAANVMHAEPDLAARVIAAWPSTALIGSYEMLMNQIRKGRPRPTSRRGTGLEGTPHPTRSGGALARAGQDSGATVGEAVDAGSQDDLDCRQRTATTTEAVGAGYPDVSGSTDPAPAPQTLKGAQLPLPNSEVPRSPEDLGLDAAPEPIPPAVLTRALRTSRRGSKRARLAAVLLRDVAPDDQRTDYALARDLAPVVDLHAGTARRYLSEWRRQATTQSTAA